VAAREWHGARESSMGRWSTPAANSFPSPPPVPPSGAPPYVTGHGREEGEGGGRRRPGSEGAATHGQRRTCAARRWVRRPRVMEQRRWGGVGCQVRG
jgi:hypothetical protein